MYAVKEIYKFEKHLNCKIDIHRREIAVLNNKVLNKQFKQAIFISKLYTSLYNNQTIKIFTGSSIFGKITKFCFIGVFVNG